MAGDGSSRSPVWEHEVAGSNPAAPISADPCRAAVLSTGSCGAAGWTAQRWAEVGERYFDDHDDVGTGADARGPALLIINRAEQTWQVRQILDDPAGDHDWGLDAGRLDAV